MCAGDSRQAARRRLALDMRSSQRDSRWCGRSAEPKGAAMPDPSQSSSAVEAGSVVGLWRYPVKSMMGEELNAAEVTDRGLLGDRAFAVVDASTGKVAGAKNPRKWGNFFDYRAAYVEPPARGSKAAHRARDAARRVRFAAAIASRFANIAVERPPRARGGRRGRTNRLAV